MFAGAITAHRQKHNLVAPPVAKKLVNDAIALARQALTPAVATTAWAAGEVMMLDEALAYALAEESSCPSTL